MREQIRVIHEELGDTEESELEELHRKLEASPMPAGPREAVERELRKAEHLAPGSPESSTAFNYIDYMLNFPWGQYTSGKFSLEHARRI